MITTTQLQTLLTILSDVDKSLAENALKFYLYFHKIDHFRVACLICMLIQDSILTLSQRLIGYYILHDLYKEEAHEEPSPFFEVLKKEWDKSTSIREKTFLTLLQTSDLSQQSLKQWLDNFVIPSQEEWKIKSTDLQPLDLSVNPFEHVVTSTTELPASMDEANPLTTFPGPNGVRTVIPDSNEIACSFGPLDNEITAESQFYPAYLSEVKQIREDRDTYRPRSADVSEFQSNDLKLKTFESTCIRPPPPLLEFTPKELFWIQPWSLNSEPIWDHMMCYDKKVDVECKELISKAVNQTLSLAESDKIEECLELNPKIVHFSDLPPSNLPDLVENNPKIAATFIVHLLSSSVISKYLHDLAIMPKSIHSMEVVNYLTIYDLPNDFINIYISSCIKLCDQMDDKYSQKKFVRLVCVFFHTLLKNGIIKVKELLVEIQSFCITFIHIKEAGLLFRAIKDQQSETNPKPNSID